jgi:hypothetical protein
VVVVVVLVVVVVVLLVVVVVGGTDDVVVVEVVSLVGLPHAANPTKLRATSSRSAKQQCRFIYLLG